MDQKRGVRHGQGGAPRLYAHIGLRVLLGVGKHRGDGSGEVKLNAQGPLNPAVDPSYTTTPNSKLSIQTTDITAQSTTSLEMIDFITYPIANSTQRQGIQCFSYQIPSRVRERVWAGVRRTEVPLPKRLST